MFNPLYVNHFLNPFFNAVPNIPKNEPPYLYKIMDAYVNFGKEEQIKSPKFAENFRQECFDFDYPLSEKVNKEDFEIMILNHFIYRRIGFQTFTAFKIQLQTKLNEIMPNYNKLFDMLGEWDLFSSGEKMVRNVQSTNVNTNQLTNQATAVSDRRYSDTPENQLSQVQNGEYLTDYNYDTNTSNSQTNGTDNSTLNSTETINTSNGDKIRIYKEFIENRKSIMTMIFDDLSVLFYSKIDI